MTVYDYSNQKYRFTGGSVINCQDWNPPQEGVLLSLRDAHDNLLTVYIDKRDAAHIAGLINAGRKYWKKFKLPKMVEQKVKKESEEEY